MVGDILSAGYPLTQFGLLILKNVSADCCDKKLKGIYRT